MLSSGVPYPGTAATSIGDESPGLCCSCVRIIIEWILAFHISISTYRYISMGGKVEEISEELGGRGNHKKNILYEKKPIFSKRKKKRAYRQQTSVAVRRQKVLAAGNFLCISNIGVG